MSPDQNAQVYLNGYIDVPEDRYVAVMAALPTHISLTREEAGCLKFEVVDDPAHPGRLQVSEIFKDDAAFEHHQTRTQASDWYRISEGIPREFSISKGKPQP